MLSNHWRSYITRSKLSNREPIVSHRLSSANELTIKRGYKYKHDNDYVHDLEIALFFGDLNHEYSHDDGHNITPDHVHGLNYNFVNNHDYNHDQFNAIMIVLTITVMTTATMTNTITFTFTIMILVIPIARIIV